MMTSPNQTPPPPLPPPQPPRRDTTISTTTPATTTTLFTKTTTHNKKRYMTLLIINYISLFIGSLASSLLAKFYFIHSGSSRWVSTWVQSAGFPLLLLPIFLPYTLKKTLRKPFTKFTTKITFLSIIIGILLGINNLLFSWGTSYLPVSTSSLLLSTQLGFTLILSWLIVKQKVTFLNVNCVILLTLSSILVGISSSHDLPKGVSKSMYFVGYVCTIGAALLFSLYLPIMEKIYREVDCYEMMMEMQLIMEISATILASIGMAMDRGFQEMRHESLHDFDLGPKIYTFTIIITIICWQLCFLGTAGMVFLTTSLTGGVCMTALLAMNVLGGVIVYGDHFGGVKAVSTVLFAWGFCSYVYGMFVKEKEKSEGYNGKNVVGEVNGQSVDRGTELTQLVIGDNA